MSTPGGWELVLALLFAGVVVGAGCRLGRRVASGGWRRPTTAGRLVLVLAALGLLTALWPVRADGTRYELQSGLQPQGQLQARLADPAQRSWLTARPLCGVPLASPLTYMQDSALRRGCAGPNARSMSIAFTLLMVAAGCAARERRPATGARPSLAA